MYRRATTLARWLGAVALVAAFALPAQAQRNVTLRLNTATLPDTTKITTDIQVRGNVGDGGDGADTLPDGNVIDWNDGTTLRPANDGGDYWSISFQIPEGDDQQLDFKFYSSQAENVTQIGGWEDSSDQPGGNYLIPGGTGDVNLVLHYFNKTGSNQPYEWRPFGAEGDSVAVWFRVYMNTQQAIERGYDRGADPAVSVRGAPDLGGSQDGGATTIDWGTSNISLTRERAGDDTKPGYDLFSGRVAYPASAVGQLQNYKFFLEPGGWEGPNATAGCSDDNRCFTVPAQDTTLMWVFYGDSPAIGSEQPVTSQIIFQVDAEPLQNVGILDLTRGDEFQVRGGFNGWDCPADNQDDCGLFREPGTLNFGNVIPVTAVPGSTSQYKYFVVLQNVDQTANPNFGYEEPLDFGGGNRTFMFQGAAQQDIGLEFYDTIRPGNVIGATEGSVDVTFRVDMTPALSYPGEDAFDPATDNVYVAFEDQIWQLTQGYQPGVLTGGIDPDFFLSPIGNNVYEGTFTVQAPTYNGIGYAYAWGSASDATTREGAGGFDPGRRRYRYVLADGNGDFPSAFAFSPDLIAGSSELNKFECNPTDPLYADRVASGFCQPNGYVEMATGIEDVGGTQPETALLSANYPNPFRSSTTFEYALPESGSVRLAVYDLTGRLIATLVDGVQPASTYRVGFEADGLASGVYLVRLQAAGSVLTRKITVMN